MFGGGVAEFSYFEIMVSAEVFSRAPQELSAGILGTVGINASGGSIA